LTLIPNPKYHKPKEDSSIFQKGDRVPFNFHLIKIKPRSDIAHILTSIEQQQLSKEEEWRNKLKVIFKLIFS